jgi:PKD repeat protein
MMVRKETGSPIQRLSSGGSQCPERHDVRNLRRTDDVGGGACRHPKEVSRSLYAGGEARARGRASKRRAGVLLMMLAGLVASSSVPALAALPVTSNPQLQLVRTIQTEPFVGSAISMKDSEGSAYVGGADDSLWLAGDNDRAIYEVNPTTGAFKRKIDRVPFEAATPLGNPGGPQAGPNRSADFESMAFDGIYLYVFSGVCCDSTVLPTVFRLAKVNGQFEVESYQPLATGSDFTASAWNASESTLYVAKGRTFNSYNYVTNTLGPPVQVPNLIGILGITFSGSDLFAVTNAEVLVRVDWPTKTIMNGWTFDLTSSGVLDSRAVEFIGDQFYVSDGYDSRPAGDPLAHAVFVYSVTDPTPTAPTASFNASPTSGEAPLTVNFTNTSTGDPTPTYSWTFGDQTSSTETSPSHTYSTAGDYIVTLVATNTGGSDQSDPITIHVTPASPPTNLVGNPGFDLDTTHWGTNGSGQGVTLARMTPGRDGTGGLAKLTNGSTRKQKCVLNDVPNWVTTTQAGTYTASIWVRDDSPFGQFKLLLKETGGALNGSQTVTRTLTTGWQLVTVSYTVKSPGTSTLDLQAFVPKNFAPNGTCFYADDVSILKS